MRTAVQKTFLIRAWDGERFLELEFAGDVCANCVTNLPYEKTVGDWEFYGKAILAIIRRWKKLLEKTGQ